uniref:Uncharacterized protein n=1 Tax=Octactis speculum TaxID=3111310 RepID=A0A7S2DXS6_9STRA|mmetsp:Transcript_55848/g.76226  ORF Transcript_55848/g.76226 Transcript_55848/m.76226 type:complete len:272 (+) Transcript_55848:227-1042(+)
MSGNTRIQPFSGPPLEAPTGGKVGADRRTKRGEPVSDEQIANVKALWNKEELKAATSEAINMGKLGIEVGLEQRQMMAMIRGVPSTAEGDIWLDDSNDLLKAFKLAWTSPWASHKYLKDKKYPITPRALIMVCEFSFHFGNNAGGNKNGATLDNFEVWPENNILSFRGEEWGKLTAARKKAGAYPAQMDKLTPDAQYFHRKAEALLQLDRRCDQWSRQRHEPRHASRWLPSEGGSLFNVNGCAWGHNERASYASKASAQQGKEGGDVNDTE